MRNLLIVDDINGNREILKKILGSEYNFLEASNGQEALEILMQNYKAISVVLLDLSMPVMNGFEVLNRMRGSATLSKIPVIIMTGDAETESEVKALSLGAVDYVSKPYNPALIKQRVKNTISLLESAATVNALQRDRLTGLYNREAFFDRAADYIQSQKPGYYVLSCFDIDKFKVVNDQYGTKEGDVILRHIGDIISADMLRGGGICGRITADNFAVLFPVKLITDKFDFISTIHSRLSHYSDIHASLTFSVGRCVVSDLSLSVSAIYDRAFLAKQSVKGRYDKHVAYFDESMRSRIVFEQKITEEMGVALENDEYEVWFQPQYNHSSGALIGAEALVRWRHPEKGLVSPAEFIPVFERNGFIYELDKYVWEKTCKYLNKWIADGLNPLPVSVNISRYDLYKEDIVDKIVSLAESYNVPPALLRLEITESAFADSTKQIVPVVKALIDKGFTIEIDDFGSGYSSLNTLKNVPAQIVKLDMRFLESSEDTLRGGNILESIVRMTKWLGMAVIAEGVEDAHQADFLKSIGCNYVQGYLYAKPMPAQDYEKLCSGAQKEEKLKTLETVENLDNNKFWDPKSMDALIFNSYIGGACIFEYHKEHIELLRANDKYAQTMGGGMTIDDALRLDWTNHLDAANQAIVDNALKRSTVSREEVTAELLFLNLPHCPKETYLRSTMRVIACADDRYLVYCTNENITAQRTAEKLEKELAAQLQVVLDNVSCGITAVVINGKEVSYLITNNRYFDMLGYTREEYAECVGQDAFALIHDEDRQRVKDATANASRTGESCRLEYRAVRKDKKIIWIRSYVSMTSFEGIIGKVQICTYTDVTIERNASQELLDNLPCGVALYDFDGKKLNVIHLNKRYWELVSRDATDYADNSFLNAVHPEDREIITRTLFNALNNNTDVVCDVRILVGDGTYSPFHITGRIIPRIDKTYAIYATYSPITKEELSYREMLPIALSTVINSSSAMSYVKDRDYKYICCSPSFARLCGKDKQSDIIGKTEFDLFNKEYADEYFKVEKQIVEKKVAQLDYEVVLPTADKSIRYGSMSKYPLLDSSGNVIGIYGTVRDVTEDHNAYQQLRLLNDSIPGGLATYSFNGEKYEITYFNDGFCRLFDLTRSEYSKISKDNPFIGILEEDLPKLKADLGKLTSANTPVDCVYRVRLKNGNFKWINLRAISSDRHGNIVSFNTVLFDVTEIQTTLENLRMSEEGNRLAIQQSGSIIGKFSIVNRTMYFTQEVADKMSLSTEISDVPYGLIKQKLIAPESENAFVSIFEEIIDGHKKGSSVFKQKVNGIWQWTEARYSTIFSNGGDPVSAVISFFDVTDRQEKEAVYKKWQQSLDGRKEETYSLYRCNISKNTTFDYREGALIDFAYAMAEFNFDDYSREYVEQKVFGADADRVVQFISSNALLANYYRGKRSDSIEYREKLASGGFRWLKLSIDLVEYPNSTDIEAYMLFENIDKEKRMELLTIEHAEKDPLTGVLNRIAFKAKVDEYIDKSSKDAKHAFLMIDIDGFKLVNDAFGHAIGDKTLIETANSLRKAMRNTDLICRLGGDEFMIFIENVPSTEAIVSKAQHLCSLVRKSLSLEVHVSGSVGIAVWPDDGMDFDTLYEKADSALYHVKGTGKDNYAFYGEGMEEARDRLEREAADMEYGLEQNKNRRMLIVDDNNIDCTVLANMFKDEFIIEKAVDGNDALIRLRHYGSAVSVVLLDLMMPGMDGFSVLEKMQESAELRSIPVIVVSGDDSCDTGLRAIKCGATDFVEKPVNLDLMRIRVYAALSKSENDRMRAKSVFMELQDDATKCYETVLAKKKINVIEHDLEQEAFIYNQSVSKSIAGVFNGRPLWQILLADSVASSDDVKRMQEFEKTILNGKKPASKRLKINLRTPKDVVHEFEMTVERFDASANKAVIILEDTGVACAK